MTMKYHYTPLLVLLLILAASCHDLHFGDEFLGEHPENSGADLEKMFESAVSADRVLTKAYSYLPYGLPYGERPNDKLGYNVLEGITDLHESFRDNPSDGPRNLYYNGALSSNINNSDHQGREAYRFGAETEYDAIRYAWIYIENAHKIPDITEAMRRRRVAEAKMIIALCYAEMWRYIGGVPLIDHAVSASEDMTYPRASFAETVDFIIRLLDEAAPALPWLTTGDDSGRMSQAGAKALKVRVLLQAASPTFNSTTPWHPKADRYTCYGDYDKERWNKVIEAAEDFFDFGQNATISLEKAAEETHQGYREAFRKAYFDRASSEVLISTRRGYDASMHQYFYNERNYSGPTLNYVNMFPWADGSDFPDDFNWENPSRQPFYQINGTPTRDPRLYETVVLPGDRYYNGLLAPNYTNHLNYISNGSGFFMKKFILEEENDRKTVPAHWPYLRLPEVMLAYAEAINEYVGMPTSKAYSMVNQIRQRVGLGELKKNMSREEFREAVLRERCLEFGYEEVRWFDLVRRNREADFRKPLYGIRATANNYQNPTAFTFKRFNIENRVWVTNWDTRWYMPPIPLNEINKRYGMEQNPGW